MSIKILSDLYLEPHLKDQIDGEFFYSENLSFPEFSSKRIVCIFSNVFRNYSLASRNRIDTLIHELSKLNEVFLISDLYQDSRIENIISDISNYDFNIGYYAQMPFRKSGIEKISSAIASFERLSSNGGIKCYFVDLDNTLIPGVWEEEKEEIKSKYSKASCGNYHSLASFLKMKASLGSQIIIVSKNDLTSVKEALDFIWNDWTEWLTHIDSGWNAKHLRINELIDKLNVGAVDCLFIDDNPIEIKSVEIAIPGLNIHRWSASYEEFFRFIKSSNLFEDQVSTYIDVRRTQYRKLLDSSISKTVQAADVDFTYSLYCGEPSHSQRILELSKKTNQFNLSKKLLVNSDLSRNTIYSWDCRTEFGYLGIIGYAIVDNNNSLVNFVMSCRALGFGLEFKVFETLHTTHEFKKVPLEITERNAVAQNFAEQIKNKYGID